MKNDEMINTIKEACVDFEDISDDIREALTQAIDQLSWRSVEDELPEGDFYSPKIFVCLSNGMVFMGCCLHKSKDATYSAKVHDWFLEMDEKSCSLSVVRNNLDLSKGVYVKHWKPITLPQPPES